MKTLALLFRVAAGVMFLLAASFFAIFFYQLDINSNIDLGLLVASIVNVVMGMFVLEMADQAERMGR